MVEADQHYVQWYAVTAMEEEATWGGLEVVFSAAQLRQCVQHATMAEPKT